MKSFDISRECRHWCEVLRNVNAKKGTQNTLLYTFTTIVTVKDDDVGCWMKNCYMAGVFTVKDAL